MLVSLGSVLITLAAPGFRGSDKAANLLPIALTIFRESRTAERFRARDWVITRLTAEHSPDGECPVFLGRLGNWCAAWSSSTTTSEC
jgi:hypothetical protein